MKNIKNEFNFIIIHKGFISVSPVNNEPITYTPEPFTKESYDNHVRPLPHLMIMYKTLCLFFLPCFLIDA
jgi:hypothetical protein